ncbi:aldehyde dehydrogenase family protein [Chloroflexota bacterium]
MSFLSDLQGEEITILESCLSPVQFALNDCILREDDPGDGCYIIDDGMVRLELKNVEADTDSVMGFLESGAFLGEFSLLDGKPRSASAYAHTEVKARWFSKEDYENICQHHPELGLKIATALGQDLVTKMREVDEKIAGFMFAGDIDKDTHEIVERAVKAQQSFCGWSEDRVDSVLKEIADTISEKAEEFAEATVAETGMGVIADKVTKIRFASLDIYKTISGCSAAGIIETHTQNQVTEIAGPVGVVLGLIPVTNPIPTLVFKTLIALKGRNALILSCHRSALGIGCQACEIIRDVLVRHGAPKDLVQPILQRSSRQKTMMFMHHPQVSLILATGGTSMVKAAYSSGTPAIGVGSGNAPVLICADADLSVAAKSIIQSKSFDNGVICGSENNLVVVASVSDNFIRILKENGAIILNTDEKNRLTAKAFDNDSHSLEKSIIGKSARFIASSTDISEDEDIRLIVVPIRQDELDGPYAHEKLAPILSLYIVNNEAEGIELCKCILESQGRGHTAVIWTKDEELMKQFGSEIEASRILVNTPASLGCCGLTTGLTPSFTLGCGTFGGNSTTDNITYTHLLNIKRLALNL